VLRDDAREIRQRVGRSVTNEEHGASGAAATIFGTRSRRGPPAAARRWEQSAAKEQRAEDSAFAEVSAARLGLERGERTRDAGADRCAGRSA